MKALLVVLFSSFSAYSLAAPIISYDDGSTYTLQDDEEVFVSTADHLFTKRDYANGNVYFGAKRPNTKRDYVETPSDEFELGSQEWCQAYIPWSEGYSFNMQAWQRYCDVNGDGVYDESDRT
ncbi:MAG: hypothetical protein CMF41_06445 [Legionellales bacterium]|mgnify:CR=1 FL=1|nr:hypothetical protein [Legionellales bacterium]OUX64129.1 MAG: hypothetical protein CBE41_03990 [Gammaproteobacteria bacterium TMED281]|tara:strand:- start:72 stop:437 length:366 start_codon:yes stop_codon:yes gene_type:complete